MCYFCVDYYFILNNGVPAENALGFQIIVAPEKPDDDLARLLNGLDERSGMTDEEKFEILRNDKSGRLVVSYWAKVAFKHFIDKGGIMTMWEMFEKEGIVAEHDRKVEARGVDKVLAILNRLDPGKVEIVKRELQLQPA